MLFFRDTLNVITGEELVLDCRISLPNSHHIFRDYSTWKRAQQRLSIRPRLLLVEVVPLLKMVLLLSQKRGASSLPPPSLLLSPILKLILKFKIPNIYRVYSSKFLQFHLLIHPHSQKYIKFLKLSLLLKLFINYPLLSCDIAHEFLAQFRSQEMERRSPLELGHCR
jgi:hypothetical protein